MKKVAIVGATGYTGQELVRLLLQHDGVQIRTLTSQSYKEKSFASVYPHALKFSELVCSDEEIDQLSREVDVIFVALPHGHAAAKVSADVLNRCIVIDLGADFRLKNAADYKQWYDLVHPNPDLLKSAVYGLPELNRKSIPAAKLIANPGCYATCSILTLAPLLSGKLIDPTSIIIDAKSGVSGAGRTLGLGVHFDECNESIKAYKVASHRHTPEIEQVLSEQTEKPLTLSFTPHLVPMNRGILVTAYASLLQDMSDTDLHQAYKEAYGDEYFIRLYDGTDANYPFPETRWVKGSNFCDIGIAVDRRNKRVIAIGALDNLVKGAAGQAIQNMNLVMGMEEKRGIAQMPLFPA